MRFIDREGFDQLLTVLVEQGHELIGPTVRDGAIVLDRIEDAGDLPRGVRETQGPGAYRLEQTGDDRLFEWAHGPDAAKRFLFPPRETIQTGHRDADGSVTITPAPLPGVRYAFIGLRACDLAAIEIQDRVFLVADPAYRARREQAVFIGVNCSAPGETCFCASMGTGPRCSGSFDVALTELDDEPRRSMWPLDTSMGDLGIEPHEQAWSRFLQGFGHEWHNVLVALDSAGHRRSVSGGTA